MKNMRIKMVLLMLLFGIINTAWATGEHWTWNSHEYAFNSTFVGVITIEGIEQRSDQLEIGAFCDGVCRGSIICLYHEGKDRYYAFLTVNGEAGMTMTFRLWNHATDSEIEVTSEYTYTFQPNDFFGVPSNPYVFPFSLDFEGPIYTGEVDMQWSNLENWKNELSPSEGDEVYILSNCLVDMDATVSGMTIIEGQTLTVQSGKTLQVLGNLTNTQVEGLVIQDGAQVVNAGENVMATMMKDIVSYDRDDSYGWYTIASPVDGMLIEGCDFLTQHYDLYRYDETNLTHEEWQNYKTGHADFTMFENGRGYLYANSNTFSPTFTGTLNHTDVCYDLTYTERTDGLSGFNLIGNPFPHVIYKGAGGAIDDDRLASGFYTLNDEGAWHVHTYDEAIQPGQGILVRTTAAADLAITKSNSAARAESSFAKSTMGRLKVSVSGDNGTDRAFAYFGPGTGLDKVKNFAEQLPALWIRDNGADYAIAHVGNDCESIDVFFGNRRSGDFTLTVNASDICLSTFQLVDHVTGATVDLLQEPTYGFHATGQEYTARFSLVLRQDTGVEEGSVSAESESFCFVKDGMLYFSKETSHAHVVLTDALGRMVKSVEMKSDVVSAADLPSGVYVVRLLDGKEVSTQRIIIQ